MRKTLLAFATAIAMMFAAPLAADAAANPSPSEPFSTLAAQWWTWAAEQPTASNPLIDPTGAQCANRQNGNTWFLAGMVGTSTNASVTRSCTIPAKTAVFFPLANAFDCPNSPNEVVPVKTERAAVAYVQNGASNLYVLLDKQNVSPNPSAFENSDVFSLTLPTDNIYGAPAGTYSPCVDAGYYALLKNLPPGSHVLQFSGTLTFSDGTHQTITVTYNLTIGS